jgi:ribosomal protein S12 methylthiotransferase
MRAGIPDLVIRTTFIVGFPGETEEDFQELLDFLAATRFDRVGIFKYSKEEGTKGAKMEGHVPDDVKADRHARAMLLLQRLSKERGEAFVGRKLRVLVERPGVARSAGDAMEIDGIVQVPKKLPVGEFAEVTVTGALEYDLIAR